MRKIWLLAFVLLLAVSLLGCANVKIENGAQAAADEVQQTEQTEQFDEEAVKGLIEDFGKKLQSVSLLSPEDVLIESMQENYGDFVSPELLAKWQNDPQNAPGRVTSSPWPDRIDVLEVEKLSENAYQVKGEIIEITSTEQASGGIAAKRPITLEVKKIGNQWLIDAAELGAYEEAPPLAYENNKYGFRFSLPESWNGYTIVTDKWEGLALDDSGNAKVVETGPIVSIRHPQWTAEDPRQDIPIMIFTLDQWNLMQQEKFHIGAAPVGPSELGRNAEYVFALPARYNFAFPTGYEEVEDILKNNPLEAVDENK